MDGEWHLSQDQGSDGEEHASLPQTLYPQCLLVGHRAATATDELKHLGLLNGNSDLAKKEMEARVL